MMDPRLDTVTQRLDRLEWETRWWRSAGLAGAAALAVLAWMGAAAPGASVREEIQARVITLVDSAGYTRAAWFVGPDGEVNFSFFDKGPSTTQAGPTRVHLWLASSGAGLSVSDKVRGAQAVLSLVAGTPNVTFRGDDGKARVVLALRPEQGGGLDFYDKTGPNVSALTENAVSFNSLDGKSRIAIGRAAGGTFLDLARDGKSRVSLGMVSDAPALELHDASGRRRVLLATSADGQPVLGLADQNGIPRAGMTVLPNGRAQQIP
jgi:hypothetical protein